MSFSRVFDNKKLYSIISGIIAYIGVYIFIKYGLVLFTPFVIAYVIAWCIRPIYIFLHKRIKLSEKFAAILTLSLTFGGIFLTGVCICMYLSENLKDICSTWNRFFPELLCDIEGACCYLDGKAGLADGCIFGELRRYFGKLDMNMYAGRVASNSLGMVIASIETIVSMVIVIVATYYFLKDKDEHTEKRRNWLFGKEINKVMHAIYVTGVAYIKAQTIIFAVTFIICMVGFFFAEFKNWIYFSIIAAFLDMLPLIGIGAVTMPLALYYLLKGNLKRVIILIIIFILCYCMREILEPRIMGKNVGLSPLMTMITIFVGYRLFGLVGVLTGPFAYIAAEEIRKMISNE